MTHTRTGAYGTSPVAVFRRVDCTGENRQPIRVESETRLALERVGAQDSHVIQACTDRNRVRWFGDVQRAVIVNI